MNKVKLNPLNPSSKKDILKQDYGGYWNNEYQFII